MKWHPILALTLAGCAGSVDQPGPRQVTFNQPGPDSTFVQEAAWSRDGATLLLSRLHIDRGYESTIARLGVDQLGVHLIAEGPQDMWADETPDGRAVVFASTRAGNRDLYLKTDRGETRLTADSSEDTHPSVSPDGSLMAFVSKRTGDSQIHLRTADGSTRPITSGAWEKWNPRWSRDGRQLTFYGNRGQVDSVYVINVDGSGFQSVTPGVWPDFTPEGKLVFVDQEAVWEAGTDGSDRRKLLDDAVLARVSPDGTRLAVIRVTWRAPEGWPNISNVFIVPFKRAR